MSCDGIDQLFGGSGNDFLSGGEGGDSIDGGSGIDTLDYSFYSGITAKLTTGTASDGDSIVGIENLIGSHHGTVLTGNAGNNSLTGESGNDFLDGAGGTDACDGSLGCDWCLNCETMIACENFDPVCFPIGEPIVDQIP